MSHYNLQRIAEMEEIYSHLKQKIDSFNHAKESESLSAIDLQQKRTALLSMTDRLAAYYESPDWRADFEADEAGLLPKDMPRGILSEDGIYNLLEIIKEMI